MALGDLVGETGVGNSQNYIPPGFLHGGLGIGGLLPGSGILQPGGGYGDVVPPTPGIVQPGGGTMHMGILGPQLPHLRRLPGPGFGHAMPLPDFNIGIQQPIQQPDYSGQFEDFGEKLGGFGETLGGYSSQFDKFGEQLGGLGEQMGGYQDALGSFNEQMGGFGKQFETVNNKLDSMEKGIAGLDQQLQTQQQPQQVQQPQPRSFNPYSNPFGFGGFGGLGSLFGRRY